MAKPRAKNTRRHEPGCPYKGEPGYLRGRIVRDKAKPGWLVLYDRATGCPPGMARIPWQESTRWVLMWRPVPGHPGKVLFRALATEAIASDALTWAAKGVDQLNLWSDRPTAVPDPKTAASRARALSARTEKIPSPGPPAESTCQISAENLAPKKALPPNIGPTGKPILPRPPPPKTREMQADEALLTALPIAQAMDALSVIAKTATRPMAVNGIMVDCDDFKVRLEALKWYGKLLLLHAAEREKERVSTPLDTSHLTEMILQSPELREELRRMCDEAERTGIVTTNIIDEHHLTEHAEP